MKFLVQWLLEWPRHVAGYLQWLAPLFALRHAIMRLPIEYREPLVLQVLGGFSAEEIARELALTPTAVLTRLFRARNKLRALCGMTPVADTRGEERA